MKRKVVVKAPINIALIKYWGKLDDNLIIPINSSISATIDSTSIYTETSIQFDNRLEQDTFKLNEKFLPLTDGMHKVLNLMDLHRIKSNDNQIRKFLFIESKNNFPTAAGLASSASGMAAFAFALYKLFELETKMTERDLCIISRQGSGSSCRSIPSLGGFVEWHSPIAFPNEASSQSYAESIPIPKEMFDEIIVLIYIISSSQKLISSTLGMKRSVETSSLLKYRADKLIPMRLDELKKAINTFSWKDICKIIIVESNSLHACMLDTYPPIFYLSLESQLIIDLVISFNEKETKMAYSFDAGPNAFLFLRKRDLPLWMEFSSTKLPFGIQIIQTSLGKQGAHLIYEE